MGGRPRISSVGDAERALRSLRTSSNAFSYSQAATESGQGRVHAALDIKGRERECRDTELMPRITPIAIGMDVTRSRGKDARVVYEQLEPMLGALHLAGVVSDPQLLFAAIGDAKSDRAPVQIGQFESDDRMDNDLSHMWLEEGGGGTGEESYELFAYAMARKTRIDAVDKRGQKGFCFITGDEAPYPMVSAEEVRAHMGDRIDEDVPTATIFAELQRKFDTFLIYPGKSVEDRREDIDAEIRQRLLKAGGRFENVSIRASLLWHTYDDLDLHVVTPNGEHIYYGNKRAECGGELDVDRNAGGRETREPVENIRWAKGTARAGRYHVFVRNFAYHDDRPDAVPFVVELDVDGTIKRFEGQTPARRTGPESDVTAFTFDYTPEAAAAANGASREAYGKEVILGKWRQYIPESHIIMLKDAGSAIEAMIGIMALARGDHDLAAVTAGMEERAVAPDVIRDVTQALTPYARQGVFVSVSEAAFG